MAPATAERDCQLEEYSIPMVLPRLLQRNSLVVLVAPSRRRHRMQRARRDPKSIHFQTRNGNVGAVRDNPVEN